MKKLRWSSKGNYLILLLATFLLHGLLLLNDGIYVDGWLYYVNLSEQRWALLSDYFLQQGIPQAVYLYRLLALFPNFIAAHKVVAFLSLLLSGFLIYAIVTELQFTSKYENLVLALFTLAFPGYQFAVEISHLWNLLPYTLFLVGWWLAFRAERASQSGENRLHLLARAGALLVLLISFMNASLLVYYFGFLLFFFICVSYHRNLSWKTMPAQVIRKYPDYMLLPLAYWFVMRQAFPPYGVFADYNQIDLTQLFLVRPWWQFVRDGIVVHFSRAFELMPVLLIIFISLLLFFAGRRLKVEKFPFFSDRVDATTLAGFGLLLLLLAMFPFVIVGKLPEPYGFHTRLSLLLGIPVSLFLLSFLRAGFSLAERRLHRAGYLFIALLFTAFLLAQIDVYLMWQARWVKEQSILLNLQSLERIEEYHVFYIEDRFAIKQPDGQIHPANQYLNQRYFQEWTGASRALFGPGKGSIGIDAAHLEPSQAYLQWVAQLKELTSPPAHDYFLLAGADPFGCTAKLTIRETAIAANISLRGLSRRYWQYRFLEPARMERFLQGLTTIDLEPLDDDQGLCISRE